MDALATRRRGCKELTGVSDWNPESPLLRKRYMIPINPLIRDKGSNYINAGDSKRSVAVKTVRRKP